ncbi:serine/threonine protein kinase [Anaerosacchariphilus polymeriproducens]|uniref:Serine/threonine protein kinase n=1 Tax=Anaerosacchariphilus polymeriproducens TaxID=1812858 RepID=A0A371ATB5_9FIRM|nr:serine/threonine-protein kinase [Anaerosacchariphilus polymeriproducens]RDU22815.1 serine/threonine protein kinase [Anaerosacchariphilus polymeriproducens]
MLEIGSIVDGKYKILNKIGQGGMSIVYLAMNEKANKQWAIKEVRKDGIRDFEIVKQGLVVETDMLKRLSHPNLPSIIDVIEDQDTFLIVMDYIEGNPLSEALEEYGALPQESVIEWAKQLCDVLGYLHSRTPAIIYRDMKPANVMLKPDGNLTLIDFGTARVFKENNIEDTTCLGTVGYAAPEQFGGQGQTDARTDIYCLGATLYHLVTGCNPCEPPYEIRPIREVNPMLSGGLEKVILKCTQRNPNDRYQSCAELMYALEHYEEIDDKYQKKQKKKMTAFIFASVLTILFSLVGVGARITAIEKTKDNYNESIDLAAKSSSIEEQEEFYYNAMEIEPGRQEAYINLMETYKQDAIFSVQEEEKLVSAIKSNKAAICEDPNAYANICFETGKMYWYYYDYGNSNDNRSSRMKASINWFDDALKYGGDEFKTKNMATVYKEIGIFYRDVPQKAIEGSDQGMYFAFFQKMKELLSLTEVETSEIVNLELYELARDSMMQYATKFKTDGVEKNTLMNVYKKLESGVKSVNTTTDKTKSMKEETVKLLESTKKAIITAYGT